jgi:MAGUK p55 subfamily member 2/6
LKVIHGCKKLAQSAVCLRAHFGYNPQRYPVPLSSKDGIAFSRGDVLQVVDREDHPFCWLAHRTVDIRSLPPATMPEEVVLQEGPVGIIPSQRLQEYHELIAKPYFGSPGYPSYSVPNSVSNQSTRLPEEFDHSVVYEEVAHVPGSQRRTVVLVGAAGVGRRALKEALIRDQPDLYSTTVKHTSRPQRENEVDGVDYFFVSPAVMEEIGEDKFFEWGAFGGDMYGTHLDTIRRVVSTGKTCIVHCAPSALRFLRNAEFMPCVVFVAVHDLNAMKAMYQLGWQRGLVKFGRNEMEFNRTIVESERLEREYKRQFDYVLLNNNMEAAYKELKGVIGRLPYEWQWVPVSWVNQCPPKWVL